MLEAAAVLAARADGLLTRQVDAGVAANAWPTDPFEISDPDLGVAVASLMRQLREKQAAVVALPQDLDDHALTVAAWNLVTLISVPVPQYNTGELVYPVEVRPGQSGSSHYSASAAAGGLHTDGSLLPVPPSIGVLLCQSPASSGGETVLVDGRTIVDGVREVDPGLLAVLREPQPFAAEDDGPEVRQWAPVLSGDDEIRYLRRYLVAGWNRAESVCPPQLTEALDLVDRIAESADNQRAFALARGEILFWRNRRFLHGRRAFDESVQRRRLVRFYGLDDPTRPKLPK